MPLTDADKVDAAARLQRELAAVGASGPDDGNLDLCDECGGPVDDDGWCVDCGDASPPREDG